MESFQIDRALKNIFEYLSEVNAYVDDQAPWALKKTDSTSWPALDRVLCSILIPKELTS